MQLVGRPDRTENPTEPGREPERPTTQVLKSWFFDGGLVTAVVTHLMTPRQFDRIARELFGAVLEPEGFTADKSRHSTFYRCVNDEIYHVIMPDPGTRCAWYDVKVFPTSPSLYEGFADRFPDDIGIPLDSWCYLSETAGVGLDQQRFNCKYENNMRNRFEKTVRTLLIEKAIPFLDRVRTMNELIPMLRGPFARQKDA